MGAHKVDCSGNAASGDSDVVVSKLTTCGEDVAIGHLTFNALGEKSKCVSSEHSLVSFKLYIYTCQCTVHNYTSAMHNIGMY